MADASAYPPHVIAAHHEAGHGVGAVFLSVPFESITIEGEGSGDGSFSTQLTWGEIKSRGVWRYHAVVCELGGVVEMLLFGESGRQCWENDQAIIDHIVSTFIADDAERCEVKLWLKKKANEIADLPNFIQAVKAVAEELTRSRFLSGPRVEEIVRQVCPSGEPPPYSRIGNNGHH